MDSMDSREPKVSGAVSYLTTLSPLQRFQARSRWTNVHVDMERRRTVGTEDIWLVWLV